MREVSILFFVLSFSLRLRRSELPRIRTPLDPATVTVDAFLRVELVVAGGLALDGGGAQRDT